MQQNLDFGGEWRVELSTFSSRETMSITGAPQALLRLWRKRGYLPRNENGGWAKHDAMDVASVYVLYSLSRLGVGPSDVTDVLDGLVADLFFFAISSGDGAIGFRGPTEDTKRLRNAFEETLGLARQIARPHDERRFLVADRGGPITRYADLRALIECERFEYFYCIDLVAAGRGMAERAQRHLLTLSAQDDKAEAPNVHRLSHARQAE